MPTLIDDSPILTEQFNPAVSTSAASAALLTESASRDHAVQTAWQHVRHPSFANGAAVAAYLATMGQSSSCVDKSIE